MTPDVVVDFLSDRSLYRPNHLVKDPLSRYSQEMWVYEPLYNIVGQFDHYNPNDIVRQLAVGGPKEIVELFIHGISNDLDRMDTEEGPDDIFDFLTQIVLNSCGTLRLEDVRFDGGGIR